MLNLLEKSCWLQAISTEPPPQLGFTSNALGDVLFESCKRVGARTVLAGARDVQA